MTDKCISEIVSRLNERHDATYEYISQENYNPARSCGAWMCVLKFNNLNVFKEVVAVGGVVKTIEQARQIAIDRITESIFSYAMFYAKEHIMDILNKKGSFNFKITIK